YSLINVTGLATGVAACLLFSLFIPHELSYDTYHEHKDRIYRDNTIIKFGNLDYNLATTPAPTAHTILSQYPEVEASTRIRAQGNYQIRKGTESFREEDVAYADSSFFSVFTTPFLYGDPSKALTEPNTIVISRKIAEKYFPNQDPVGQTLTLF